MPLLDRKSSIYYYWGMCFPDDVHFANLTDHTMSGHHVRPHFTQYLVSCLIKIAP